MAILGLLAFASTLYGLLMINYPYGNNYIPALNTDLLAAMGLKSFFIVGLMLILVGMVNIGAFFSLSKSGTYQYRWSITGGIFLSLCMIITIISTASHYWVQAILAGAGIMIILLSLQLKGKWVI